MARTLTLVPDSPDVWGKHRVEAYDVALDSSYPTGGYSISARDLGWSEITGAFVTGESGAAKGYDVVWDTTNKKLMLFTAASTEVSAATNVSTVKIRMTFVGV